MDDWVWKGVQSYIIRCFDQLSLNKFFELSTSMRKGRDGEKNGKWKKETLENGK